MRGYSDVKYTLEHYLKQGSRRPAVELEEQPQFVDRSAVERSVRCSGGRMSIEKMAECNWSSPIVEAAARLVVAKMSTYTGSHDHTHVFRVHALALRIADEVSASQPDQIVNRDLVELGALMHDVYDHKLWKPDLTDAVPRTAAQRIADDLVEQIGVQDPAVVERVVQIAHGISYSKQQKHSGLNNSQRFLEMDIVQDADRLDALGAVGIARCFHFSGSLERHMTDARLHCDEKLFKLPDLMRTKPGARMAAEKLNFMKRFIKQYDEELKGRDGSGPSPL
jgi:uncharacterized protein